MLFSLSLFLVGVTSLLLPVVSANFFRANNEGKGVLPPIGMTLADEKGMLYQFIQDPMHPHEEGAVAIRVAESLPISLTPFHNQSIFYSCETFMVTRLAKHRFMMMLGDVYDVSRHRAEGFWVFTRQKTRTVAADVLTLVEASDTMNCVEDVETIESFTLPRSARSSSSFVGAASNAFLAGNLGQEQVQGQTVSVYTGTFFSADDGSLMSTVIMSEASSELISAAAHEACPQCIEIAGWDGQQYWFQYLQYGTPYYYSSTLVLVSQTGQLLRFANARRAVISTSLVLVAGQATTSFYNLIDGTLGHFEQLPYSYLYNELFLVSPDGSRILEQQYYFNHFGTQLSHLLERNITTGELLAVRQLPKHFNAGCSVSDDFWVAKAGREVHKFSWNY